MPTLPLLPHYRADQTIAYRQSPGQGASLAVSQAQFLREVLALAERLPATGHVFNMCRDRYWFAVSLFAAIRRGMVSLLQNSTAPENMALLASDYPDALCLCDQATPAVAGLPQFLVAREAHEALEAPAAAASASGLPLAMPQIPREQCIVRIFTSGSTGRPQAHAMTFWRMQRCAVAEAQRMWQAAGATCTVLGTVSPQHMFGLEASVLLPIFGGGAFSARQPFFPADVASALAELPEPRLLVSTPFHLRKLMDAEVALPRVAALLSATAPLALALAQTVEARLDAPMVEIYGSTETGAIATRRPTQGSTWETYAGISVVQQGEQALACAAHFEAPQALGDVLALHSPSRFDLLGRNADMVNIVGKRSSLAYLNQLLQGLPGVQDGVFCMHSAGVQDDKQRLAAFVVAPGQSSAALLAALRLHVDPVFLPRPLVLVASLPRDSNGKITAAALAQLRATHLCESA